MSDLGDRDLGFPLEYPGKGIGATKRIPSTRKMMPRGVVIVIGFHRSHKNPYPDDWILMQP
jgi:hypothetical protein